MIARCARCQGTFTTDTFGLQTCPHCGSELLLADPGARGAGSSAAPGGPSASPPGAPPASPPGAAPVPPPGQPAWGAPPPPPEAGRPAEPPPPPPPPPGGYPPPPGGWAPPPRATPPGGGDLPSPFAERSRLGLLPALVETFKLVGGRPADFFARVRTDQVGAAVLFGVIGATIGNAGAVLYSWLTRAATLAQLEEGLATAPAPVARFLEGLKGSMEGMLTGTALALQLLLTPVFAVVAIYLSAAVFHLLLLLFRGAARGFDATLTAVAYATGLTILSALPVCGGLLASGWYLVALIIGLGAVHRCGPGKAAAAVFAPLVLLCACCCGLGMAGFGAAMKAFGGAGQPPAGLNL